MRIRKSKRFQEDFARLPRPIQERARKQLALFLNGPQHPSLRAKKMQGRGDVWEARVSSGYRFTFTISGDLVVLRRIGPHDVLRTP